MTLDESLIHTTIKIISIQLDGSHCSGTGFFFNFEIEGKTMPTIITNKHVVKDSKELLLLFSLTKNEKTQTGNTQIVHLTDPNTFIINHPDKDVDLCAIFCDVILNSDFGNRLLLKCFCAENIVSDEYIENSISNIEDITLIGYPDGLYDAYNNLPVVRRGITATSIKYDYNNKKEFLIDSAVFPGSSGSPVLIFNQGAYGHRDGLQIGNRLFLIGILSSGYLHMLNGELKVVEFPSAGRIISQASMPNNLGIVIKAKRILELIPEIKLYFENSKK